MKYEEFNIEDFSNTKFIKMDAIDYIDIEDCDYFKDNMKERHK